MVLFFVVGRVEIAAFIVNSKQKVHVRQFIRFKIRKRMHHAWNNLQLALEKLFLGNIKRITRATGRQTNPPR